jgi:hypothetical protein
MGVQTRHYMYITPPFRPGGFAVTQSVKIIRVFKEPEDSLPYLQNPAIGPYHVSVEFSFALTSSSDFHFNITVLFTVNLFRGRLR